MAANADRSLDSWRDMVMDRWVDWDKWDRYVMIGWINGLKL